MTGSVLCTNEYVLHLRRNGQLRLQLGSESANNATAGGFDVTDSNALAKDTASQVEWSQLNCLINLI